MALALNNLKKVDMPLNKETKFSSKIIVKNYYKSTRKESNIKDMREKERDQASKISQNYLN